MWYEIIPAMAVVGAGLYLPLLGALMLHEKVYGVPYRRSSPICLDRALLLRDMSLCDHPFSAGRQGLSNIPDE